MIDPIVEQTNLYATQYKNEHNFKTDRDEIKKFLRLRIMSAIIAYLQKITIGAQPKISLHQYFHQQ